VDRQDNQATALTPQARWFRASLAERLHCLVRAFTHFNANTLTYAASKRRHSTARLFRQDSPGTQAAPLSNAALALLCRAYGGRSGRDSASQTVYALFPHLTRAAYTVRRSTPNADVRTGAA